MGTNSDVTVVVLKNDEDTARAKLEGHLTDAADVMDSLANFNETGYLFVSACGASVGPKKHGHKTGGPDVIIVLRATVGLGSLLLVVHEASAGITANHSHNDGKADVAITVKTV